MILLTNYQSKVIKKNSQNWIFEPHFHPGSPTSTCWSSMPSCDSTCGHLCWTTESGHRRIFPPLHPLQQSVLPRSPRSPVPLSILNWLRSQFPFVHRPAFRWCTRVSFCLASNSSCSWPWRCPNVGDSSWCGEFCRPIPVVVLAERFQLQRSPGRFGFWSVTDPASRYQVYNQLNLRPSSRFSSTAPKSPKSTRSWAPFCCEDTWFRWPRSSSAGSS